jgi:hypothetical protein
MTDNDVDSMRDLSHAEVIAAAKKLGMTIYGSLLDLRGGRRGTNDDDDPGESARTE